MYLLYFLGTQIKTGFGGFQFTGQFGPRGGFNGVDGPIKSFLKGGFNGRGDNPRSINDGLFNGLTSACRINKKN